VHGPAVRCLAMAGTLIPTLEFEESAWSEGYAWVIGADEVGVGSWAGPVAAAAVALPSRAWFAWMERVRDSKVLAPARREELAEEIAASVPTAVGWASPEEVDRQGLTAARRLAVLRAVEQLGLPRTRVISDALSLPLPDVVALVDADARCVSVAAASVVAKVARDALMRELCALYPGYAFCRNKGYGTPEHRRALRRRGPSPVHRRSYLPVAQLLLPW